MAVMRSVKQCETVEHELEFLAVTGMVRLYELKRLLGLVGDVARRLQIAKADALKIALEGLVSRRRKDPNPEREGYDYVDVYGELIGIRDKRYPEDPKLQPHKRSYGERDVRYLRGGRLIKTSANKYQGITVPVNVERHIKDIAAAVLPVLTWLVSDREQIDNLAKDFREAQTLGPEPVRGPCNAQEGQPAIRVQVDSPLADSAPQIPLGYISRPELEENFRVLVAAGTKLLAFVGQPGDGEDFACSCHDV